MATNCLRDLEQLSPGWTFDATYKVAVPPPCGVKIPLFNALSGTKCDKMTTQAAMKAMSALDINIPKNIPIVTKFRTNLLVIEPPNEDEMEFVIGTGHVIRLSSTRYRSLSESKNGTVRQVKGEIRVNSGSTWCRTEENERLYHRFSLRNIDVSRARAVLWAFKGPPPGHGYTCDHINRNQQDDRPENLRWATYTEQAENQNRYDVLEQGDLLP